MELGPRTFSREGGPEFLATPLARQKVFSPSFTFSKFSYRQNMFLSRNLNPSMPKSMLI